MTSQMLPMYGTAVLTVGMLALFARQNMKSGWRKERLDFAQTLHRVYDDFGIGDENAAFSMSRTQPATAAKVAEWTPVTGEEALAFSTQLIRLRAAVGSSGMAPVAVEAESELIKVRV